MQRFIHWLVLGGSALFSASVFAGSAVFSTTNIQYLYSTEYNPIFGSSEERSILTMEHYDVWNYGDNFFFVDAVNPEREDDAGASVSYYGEFSPRFSIGKIFTGKAASFGLVKDLYLATTLEMPQSPVRQTFLYGLGSDLDLPGFSFFQANIYVRDNQSSDVGDGQQVTFVWGAPFTVGRANFLFTGFFDYAWGQDGIEDNIVSAPQLLLDIGSFFDKPGIVDIGLEYQIWRNQFGIEGEDENALQLLLKWTLH
jgi:nucleoside-specific outer membrane channel protein Tsx